MPAIGFMPTMVIIATMINIGRTGIKKKNGRNQHGVRFLGQQEYLNKTVLSEDWDPSPSKSKVLKSW